MAESLEQSEPDTFVGLFIENNRTKFRIVVKFKGDSKEKVDKHVKDKELLDAVTPEDAKVSKDELKKAQETVMNSLSSAKIENFSRLDVQNNRVIVFVKALAQAQVVLNGLSVSDGVVLEERANFPVPVADVNGGGRLQSTRAGSTSQYCTAAFSVIENGTTRRGIVTAGHCSYEPYSYSGQAAPRIGEAYYGNFDVQWHTTGTNRPVNRINMGSNGTQAIYGQRSVSAQTPGQVVQFHGERTSFHWGDIIDNAVRWANPAGGTTGPWVLVTDYGSVVCNGGDSGGPVVGNQDYVFDYAYGIMTNCSANNAVGGTEMWYMPVERISSVNVQILMTP